MPIRRSSVLTGRFEPTEIARALDLGADDCLKKPFALVELLARLRATVRRGAIPRAPLIRVADLALNPSNRQVTRGGHEIFLTPTEFRLLEFLVRRAGRILSREVIEHSVWGFADVLDHSNLDIFIRHLRDKIDKGLGPKLIRNVRGVGFSVRADAIR